MCGITGIFAFNLVGKFNKIHVTDATLALQHRGPDYQDIYLDEWVALGHRRLSIIDTSEAANQPMWDESGRYGIVFNGEIFNYRELRGELQARGAVFRTQSDTEVLLQSYIRHKEDCLQHLNGFFALCIYDRQEESLFVARDRMGIKPLLYVFDEDKFLFASEMKSILKYGIERDLNPDALLTYFQLNYIPAPLTIYQKVQKLLPGHYIKVRRQQLEVKRFYAIQLDPKPMTYEQAQRHLFELMESSVQSRLVADVQLGTFLSGGVDSSVITALASRHKQNMHSFSIGYRDEKFFDETDYAMAVAKHLGTEHTVFRLSNDEMASHLQEILRSIDEPFADSSSVAVYILSKYTRRHVTVALSGDGADELFGGYNKHAALLRSLQPGLREWLVQKGGFLWKRFPQSRNNFLANRMRQLSRFASGMDVPLNERYWHWAAFATEGDVQTLLQPLLEKAAGTEYKHWKGQWLAGLESAGGMNDLLLADCHLVLPNDMLTKVDLMSMANSLEVRVPFLDYRVVDFAFSQPSDYKIDRKQRKKLVQDTFRSLLPPRLYNRPKKGFEVPLLKWLRRELRSTLEDLLNEKFVRDQRIFNPEVVARLKSRLYSHNPGDAHARIWALLVFQSWWTRYHRPS